jgi:DNA polymerase elongation subunit (family B)
MNNLFQGILPEILEELLTARKRAKADLKVKHLIPKKLLQCVRICIQPLTTTIETGIV